MKLIFSVIFLSMGTLPLLRADVKSDAREIDAVLEKDWAANKLAANPPASDEVFVRRVYLDVAGRIPTFRETEEFLASKQTGKRDDLIVRLLASEGYVSNFFNYWSDILRNHSKRLGGTLGTAYGLYLKESLRTNKPYDQLVRELVSSLGKGWENGAVGYYMRDFGMPLDNMANTVRIFLGTRIECAQCHDHPFDKWKQMEFYKMAAFINGVDNADYSSGPMTGVMQRIKTEEASLREKVRLAHGKPSPELLAEQKEKTTRNRFTHSAVVTTWGSLYYASVDYRDRPLRLPHDYKYADGKPKDIVHPATIMGRLVTPAPDAPPLKDYAAWMTSPGNPRFTKVIANRLWKKVFGLGLHEPVDELTDTTPAANPELMAHLERLMISVNYDMRAYLRVLLNTRAYQSAVTRDEVSPGSNYHFTGPLLRRMNAEQVWDSIGTLINPTPDVPNIEARDNLNRRLLAAKKLSDALDALTPEERESRLVAAGMRAGAASEKVAEINKKIVLARANGDKAQVDSLMKQAEPLRLEAQQSVNDEVLIPVLTKLYTRTTGDTSLPKSDKPVTDPISQIPIPGYELPRKNPALVEAAGKARELAMEMGRYFGVPEKEMIYFPGACATAARTWPRAADVGSPAPEGHYLREFGQSDRETIENSNSDASIPQTLILMNSEILSQIMAPKSQLLLSINKATGTAQQMENVYLALLSRKPTTDEKHRWSEAQSRGLDSMEDLVFALINAQQFIFIQ
jgi:hypothetical protein